MELNLKVKDERGEELDAVCSLVDADTGKWNVTLISRKGVRGHIALSAPSGTTLEGAIEEMLRKGIAHAKNNP